MIDLQTILFVITVSVILLLLLSYYIAEKALKPAHRKKTKNPGDYGLPFEDVTFSSQGKTLKAWIIKQPDFSPGHQYPFIMLIHGWESSMQGMLNQAKLLFESGYNLFLYDTRGHGDSPKMKFMTLIRFWEDAESALAYLKSRKDCDPNRIALFGHSMGGATSIHLAARHPEINAAVISSSFADFDEMNKDMLKGRRIPYIPFGPILKFFWIQKLKVNFEDWNPSFMISKIGMPLFIAFGHKDEMFNPNHFELLKKNAVSSTVQTLVLPEGGHRNLYEFDEYRSAVLHFFQKHFTHKNLETRKEIV